VRKPSEKKKNSVFDKIFDKLFLFYGPQHWWPARTRFEVILGAILTQNTSWSNVKKAIKNLKQKKMLTPAAILKAKVEFLGELIRPSGYFNIKAKRLKNFTSWLFDNYSGSLSLMFKEPLHILRNQLLEVNGLGEETVDSILLYAGDKPVFVVDAYTRRIFARHGLINAHDKYAQIQKKFMENLKKDVRLYNEYHALIVALGKNICLNKLPKCRDCPLADIKG